MDSALGTLGADTDSIAYKVGKVGGEIAGTAGLVGWLRMPRVLPVRPPRW